MQKTAACTWCRCPMWNSGLAALPLCQGCRRVIGAMPRQCRHCGAAFGAIDHRRGGHYAGARFCSPVCRRESNERYVLTSGRTPRKGRTCSHCGATFTANNTEQATCSVECHRAANPAAPKPPPSCRVYFPSCDQCGRTFTARSRRSRLCSYRCRLGDIGERSNGLYALAAQHGMAGARWRDLLVGYLRERDGDRCQCGCRRCIRFDLRSGPHGDDRGPSVDHVIPRSRGGSDDLANLRLLRWGCNRARGNRGGNEQLALVG